MLNNRHLEKEIGNIGLIFTKQAQYRFDPLLAKKRLYCDRKYPV